jgi:chemotaxis signal transduction protein
MDKFPTISFPEDDAGVYQLEQLSDEQFWEYARTLADRTSSLPVAQEYLECMLSNGCCLVPLATLDEVVLSPQRFAFLPASPHWMLGLAAWHGETIAIIDLDAYLAQRPMNSRSTEGEGMVLMAHSEHVSLGLLVGSVGRTLAMDDVVFACESATLPAWYLPSRARFVQGMVADAVILDIPLLLAEAAKEIEITTPYGR